MQVGMTTTRRVGGALQRLLGASLEHNTVRRASLSARVKRFYKNVTVAGTPGCYEINLDHRKLKTPLGNVLQMPSYPLALAVAQEWAAVKKEIVPPFMHLTALSYTVVDNPRRISKWDMTEEILQLLPTDTMLFADEGSEEFSALQQREWWPVLQWFNERHQVSLSPSLDITPAKVSVETLATLRRHILSYNHFAVAGIKFSVEAAKSVILALAAVERRLTASKALALSRLEVDYQVENWGNVEWSHDMELHDLEARFAAGLMFAHLNSAQEHTTIKKKHTSYT